MKTRVREAAPDLWSVRSIVLEIPAIAAPSTEVAQTARAWGDSSVLFSLRELMNLEEVRVRAEQEVQLRAEEKVRVRTEEDEEDRIRAEDADRRGSQAAAGHSHLQVATGALERGDLEGARAAAEKAELALRGKDWLAKTEAQMTRARVELRLGNAVEAARLSLAAVDERRQKTPDLVPVEWLDVVGRALLLADRPGEAEQVYSNAEDFARLRLRQGERADLELDLCVALEGKADARLREGRLDDAVRGYAEMGERARMLLEEGTGSWWTSTLYGHAMMKLGGALRLQGESAQALTCFEEAERIWAATALEGMPVEPLREQSAALNRIGELRLEGDDLEGAVDALRAAADLRRALLVSWERTPKALRQLASSLHKLGDAELRAGRSGDAKDIIFEALALENEAAHVTTET
jgi:tetratricopeptide (TPR) repeat protein